MIKVRELLYLEELPAWIKLAEKMQRECEPDIPFDSEELYKHGYFVVNDSTRQNANVWVAIRDKQMIGMAVGLANKFFYSTAVATLLLYIYTIPTYRYTRAALELLRHFEKWSRDVGAVRMHVGADRIDVEQANIANRMFAKRGFTRYGEQFYKVLNDGIR